MTTLEPHYRDLLSFLIWLVGILGLLGSSLVVWAVKLAIKRLDSQDAQLGEIRDLLASELKLLREDHHALDVRVTRIESKCEVVMTRNNHEQDRS